LQLILASAALPLSGQAAAAAQAPSGLQRGTATDPDLVNPVVPWPLVLSKAERVTIALLADLILPADERSPSASEVGVPAFINEWVSAPYAHQQGDLERLREGLAWLEAESRNRAGKPFHDLDESVQIAICEDISDETEASDAMKAGADFFSLVRFLCLAGFYTTEAGRKDLGYIGNVPLSGDFPGATEAQKKFLGL
jgi:hypothetical protein